MLQPVLHHKEYHGIYTEVFCSLHQCTTVLESFISSLVTTFSVAVGEMELFRLFVKRVGNVTQGACDVGMFMWCFRTRGVGRV